LLRQIRALRLVGEAERIGFYGFGSSAHILRQVAAHEGRRVFAFTRDGDAEGQAFARRLGAEWAGGSSELPPEVPVRAEVTTYPLEDAQRALEDARAGRIEGSAVLVVSA
jgi:alcohol dehydrogenase, propanol-preferring